MASEASNAPRLLRRRQLTRPLNKQRLPSLHRPRNKPRPRRQHNCRPSSSRKSWPMVMPVATVVLGKLRSLT